MARFDRVIPPGEEGTIEALVETEKYQGPIAKGLTVRTNDAEHRVASLQIKANVITWIDVFPRWLVSVQSEHGKGQVVRLILRARDAETDYELIGATSSHQEVDVTILPMAADDEKGDYELRVEISPDAPIGPIDAKIVVSTTLEQQRRLRIPVLGKIMGPINFFPAHLVLFADDSGRPPRLSGTLVLQARPGHPEFELASVEADSEKLELTPFTEGAASVHRIGIHWKDPADVGIHAGNIRIKTSSDQMPEISVPYQVRIQ